MGAKKLISVVLPVFNEAGGLGMLYDRLKDAIPVADHDAEFIFVNDGSTDNSLDVLAGLRARDERVKIIDLSRNFGHQNALSAGIDHARGDAVVLMDADMEDDPASIASFMAQWQQGYQVVYARRGKRKASWLRSLCFTAFHKANRMISDIDMEAAGIFCLMDRRVVEHLKRLTEKDKYIPGLRRWIGFRQTGIDVARDARYDRNPRVRFRGLFKLALDSFTSFSTVPLQVSMFLGILFSVLSFIGILIVMMMKLVFKVAILGWASTICVILLAAGVQLICLWLQGEYLSRIFNEVKNRPNYIVREAVGFNG